MRTLARRLVSKRSNIRLLSFLLLAVCWLALRVGAQEVTAVVSNGNDRGPGSLREALFVVASAKEPASVWAV